MNNNYNYYGSFNPYGNFTRSISNNFNNILGLEIKNLDTIINKIIKNFNLDKIKTTNRDEINYILNKEKFVSFDFERYCSNILMQQNNKKDIIKENEQPEQN